jgi:hypothetical protein
VLQWLSNHPGIDQSSAYVIRRNGNSWKFGGSKNRLDDAKQ